MTKDLRNESDNNKFIDKVVRKEYTLSIETGIAGGSIALFKDNTLIDSSVGQCEISRSEDVLEGISNILSENNVKKTQIKLIVFSRGPGSFTGIRIGVALARGLSKSFDCDYLGLSVLEAMSDKEQEDKKVIAAVNFGKNQVCWQIFRIGPESETLNLRRLLTPRVSTTVSFIQDVELQEFDNLILYNRLYNNLLPSITKSTISSRIVINAGDNLAVVMGNKAEKPENRNLINQRKSLEPIYIRGLVR
jgi:tRNA threonylcarbamoyl adenosine modification protein YeaZ